MLYRGKVTIVYFLLFCTYLISSADLPANIERDLIEELLIKYDVNARPTSDPRNAVEVHVDFILDRILQVDEESQTILSTGKVTLVWKDEYLSWNETKYKGVKTLLLDKSRVWLPDAEISNRNRDSIVNGYQGKVNVNSDGQILWSTRGTFATFCSVVMTKVPFDQHVCAINIEPVVSTKKEQIFLTLKNNSTSVIQENSGWSFMINSWSCSSSGQSDINQYSTCTLLFTVSRLDNRRYIISAVPLVVLSVMSCFVFILSAKTVEKMAFILVVFATYTLVLFFVQESIYERIHSYNYLSLYFVIEFGIISLTAIVAVFTVNITCKDDLNISPCLKGFARVMTCKTKKHVSVISSERNDIVRAPGMDMAYKARTGKFSDSSGSEYVDEITWVDVAAGFDRLFFILFLLVNIVLSVVMLSMITT